MGRRISYRPNRSQAHPAAAGRVQNRLSTTQIIGVVGGGFVLLLLLVGLVGYFIIQNRKFQQEFAPLISVCQGRWVDGTSAYSTTPGQHPGVSIRDSDDGWYLDSYFISGGALAQSVAETQLVLCVGKSQVIFIERCGPYTSQSDPSSDNYVIDRYYYRQDAKLVEAKTGRVIAAQSFTGNAPPVCHRKERLSVDDYTTKLVGSEVSESDIRSWVSSFLYVE